MSEQQQQQQQQRINEEELCATFQNGISVSITDADPVRSFTMSGLDHSVNPSVGPEIMDGSQIENSEATSTTGSSMVLAESAHRHHDVYSHERPPWPDQAQNQALASWQLPQGVASLPSYQLAAAQAAFATQQAPYIVKITNASPFSPSHIITGNFVLYIFGEPRRHQDFVALVKQSHKVFARAQHRRDKEKHCLALMKRITVERGHLCTEHGFELPYEDVTNLLWSFLQQRCYVNFDPEKDVGGRGKTASLARGHQQYLQQCKELGAGYVDPQTDDFMKREIAQYLVDWVYIHQQGQFVRKCKITNQYYILEHHEELKRAMQSLREYKKYSSDV